MTILKLTLKEGEEATEHTSISFNDFIQNYEQVLKCARCDPPLSYKNTLISQFNFINLNFEDGMFSIFIGTDSALISVQSLPVINLSIIDPVPLQQPEVLSTKIRSLDQTCFAQIFHKNPDSGVESFLTSLSCNWNKMGDAIQDALKKSTFGAFGPVVCLAGNEVVADIAAFFADARIMALARSPAVLIVVSRSKLILTRGSVEYTLDQVPRLPRNLIYRAVHVLQSTTDENILRLCRRLITVAFNGGIPVHLLDWLKIDNPGSSHVHFASKDFDRGVVNLTRQHPNPDVDDHLIFNFKKHLLVSASETDFRSLFWDGVISKFFVDGPEKDVINFRLSSEWSTSTLLGGDKSKSDPHRRVDFVSLIRIGQEVPILLVEMGNKPFSDMHKDFSKLLSLVSATCIKMAHMLIARNKCPELARAYGIWIGGAQFQFCVAIPVIRVSKQIPDNFEVHANISFFPHWKFDLLSNSNLGVGCVEICCSSDIYDDDNKFEPTISGAFEDEKIESEETFKLLEKHIDVEEEDEEEAMTSYKKSKTNDLEVCPKSPERQVQSEIEPPSTPEAQISGNPPKDVPLDYLYKGIFNLSALEKMKCFIETIKNRINIILSNDSGKDNRGLKYNDPPGIFMLPGSLKNAKAPNTESFNRTSVSSMPVANVKKNSQSEMKTRQHLAPLICFPRVYSSKIAESGEVEYEMEWMQSMIDPESGCLCDQLQGDTFDLTLVNYLRFGLHVLYGLHTLHTVTALVHSDISPGNIMYSSVDGFWKINDFDQTMNIEESKSLSRTAGTPGFISPESQKSGIFTPQSDIFALGKIFFNLFYPTLLSFDVEEESSEEKFMFKFERIMFSLSHVDPSRRPSALEALRLLYSLLEEVKVTFDDDFLISTCIKYLLENSDTPQMLQPVDVVSSTEFISKLSLQPPPVEREDPHLKSIVNAPQ